MSEQGIEPCPTDGCDGLCKMNVGHSGLWGQIKCQGCGYRSALTEDPQDAIHDHHRRCALVRLGKQAPDFLRQQKALVKACEAALNYLPTKDGELKSPMPGDPDEKVQLSIANQLKAALAECKEPT